MNFRGVSYKGGDSIGRLQELIASTKWRGMEKEHGVPVMFSNNSGKQGILSAVADKIQQPLEIPNEEGSFRWFRLFGGVNFNLGGSIPTERGLQPKEFYWRHTFDDSSVGDGQLLLMAVNGDSIVYVHKSRICWIRGESCSVVEAFSSLDELAEFLVFTLNENQMIDSFCWEEYQKSQ